MSPITFASSKEVPSYHMVVGMNIGTEEDIKPLPVFLADSSVLAECLFAAGVIRYMTENDPIGPLVLYNSEEIDFDNLDIPHGYMMKGEEE
jgi:hypothetical protein